MGTWKGAHTGGGFHFCRTYFTSFFRPGDRFLSAENITVSGIAGRYATALFDLAVSAKELDAVASDLATINSMMEENKDLARLVKSPIISRADQARAMGAVLEKLGVGDLVRRFVGTVAQNRRLFALAGMIGAYNQLLAAERGEVVARVSSAKKLSESQLNAVSAALKSAIGSDVSLESDVDESLIGGLVIKVGSRMVDNSIRTKLQNLKFAMKGVG
jgi:F-type H+-transporting ATPase subunit delta